MSRSAVCCSHCHAMVSYDPGAGAVYCPACLHRADVSRMDCDCPLCGFGAPAGTAASSPAPTTTPPAGNAALMERERLRALRTAHPTYVHGRSVRKPVVNLRLTDGALVMHIDDEGDPEFWVTIQWDRSRFYALAQTLIGALDPVTLHMLSVDVACELAVRSGV